MACHVQRTLTSGIWITQFLTGIHLACWHFESYFIDIAYNYVRRTTHCFKKFKKNIALVQGCVRCIIHYDGNVMEKEVCRLTEASFSTIWRSADVRQTQVNIALRPDDICKTLPPHFNSEIHCSHKWCYRQFTDISRMLKRKHSTGEQTEESTAESRSLTLCPQKENSGLLFPQKECLFLWKRSQEAEVIHRWFEVAIKERTREMCDIRQTNLKKNW